MNPLPVERSLATGPLDPPSADRVVYVYGFVDPIELAEALLSPSTGGPLSVHRVGTIGAVICHVAMVEFCGVESERNLADPAWIMPRICHHEAVVERVMVSSPVFPARFATLYRSLDSLTDFMRKHEKAIARFLRQVTGQQEWALSVTVELDDLATLDALALELWPEWSGYTPGRRYLRLRQERPGLLKVARERASEAISIIVDALRPLATAIRPLPGPVPQLNSCSQHVEKYAVLNSVERQSALQTRVQELAAEPRHQHVRLVLSGPWPPYSFRPLLDDKQSEASERITGTPDPTWPLASRGRP